MCAAWNGTSTVKFPTLTVTGGKSFDAVFGGGVSVLAGGDVVMTVVGDFTPLMSVELGEVSVFFFAVSSCVGDVALLGCGCSSGGITVGSSSSRSEISPNRSFSSCCTHRFLAARTVSAIGGRMRGRALTAGRFGGGGGCVIRSCSLRALLIVERCT